MPAGLSYGFFFNAQKWRSSRAVQRMSFAERGVYFEMLVEQWERRNLPDDVKAVAEIIAPTEAHEREVEAAWPVVRTKFLASRGNQNRIYNAQLERTRREQAINRRKRQYAGHKGGMSKARNLYRVGDLEASNATALLQRAVAKPREKKGKEIEKKEDTHSVLFVQFWSAYPKKKAKEDAQRAWDKRRPNDDLLAVMLRALERQKQSPDWQKESGRYIPLPATWLNGARWTDEEPEVRIGAQSRAPSVDKWELYRQTKEGE